MTNQIVILSPWYILEGKPMGTDQRKEYKRDSWCMLGSLKVAHFFVFFGFFYPLLKFSENEAHVID
jgi:hypothetical protein